MTTNNYSDLRKSLNDKRDSVIFNLSDSELKALFTGKDSKAKLINIFTFSRARRIELIKKGYIVFGLVYSANINPTSNLIRTRILFSPSYDISDNKEVLIEIADNINNWIENAKFNKLSLKEKRVYQALTSNEEEPSYFQIPEYIVKNKLVYVSLTFIEKQNFRNGMIPILINKKVSKEVLVIPYEMYSEEYINFLNIDK